MKYINVFLFLLCMLFAGCGGTAVKTVKKAAEEKKVKITEKAVQVKETAETKTEQKKEKVEAKVEKAMPALPPILFVRVILVNSLSLEGIITGDTKKTLTLRTEVGTVTLSKDRIEKIVPAKMPEALSGK